MMRVGLLVAVREAHVTAARAFPLVLAMVRPYEFPQLQTAEGLIDRKPIWGLTAIRLCSWYGGGVNTSLACYRPRLGDILKT